MQSRSGREEPLMEEEMDRGKGQNVERKSGQCERRVQETGKEDRGPGSMVLEEMCESPIYDGHGHVIVSCLQKHVHVS